MRINEAHQHIQSLRARVRVYECVHARVCACVRVCACARVCACVRERLPPLLVARVQCTLTSLTHRNSVSMASWTVEKCHGSTARKMLMLKRAAGPIQETIAAFFFRQRFQAASQGPCHAVFRWQMLHYMCVSDLLRLVLFSFLFCFVLFFCFVLITPRVCVGVSCASAYAHQPVTSPGLSYFVDLTAYPMRANT